MLARSRGFFLWRCYLFNIKHFHWLIFSSWMLLVCFLKVFLFVKANGTWFLKGGREDWCDTAGLTANMWRRPVSRRGAEVVGCLGFFPLEAGNLIIDGNSVGFNNFQNEIWARGLLGLMRDRKQDTDFRRLFRSLWILWNWVAFHLRSTFVQLSPSVYKLQSRSRHWWHGWENRLLWYNSCSEEGDAELRTNVFAAVVENNPDLP